MTRLLAGYNYFWNLKPSEMRPVTIVYLHEWLKLLKSAAGKTENEAVTEPDLYEAAKKIFI